MEHIKIEQTSNVEVVDSNIIHKLAEEAQDCDASSNMTGNLQTTNAYEDDVDFLTTKFPGLSINATQGLYLRIADPTVQNILATNFGDGTGITKTQAQLLQHFNDKFINNTDIETFNELSKFTNITEINRNNRFNSCTNLKSIDLSNITKISGSNGYERWNFEFCSNLEDVGDTSNVTYFGEMAFWGCTKLTHIDISSAEYIIGDAFYNCSSLIINEFPTSLKYINDEFRNVTLPQTIDIPGLETIENKSFTGNASVVHIKDLGTISKLGDGTDGYNNAPFSNCPNLEDAIIPETVTKIGHAFGSGSNNIRWIKILSNSVPELCAIRTFGAEWTNPYMDPINGTYVGKTYPIYVKDSLLTQYQSATNWEYIASRLRPLSQFATDFPND